MSNLTFEELIENMEAEIERLKQEIIDLKAAQPKKELNGSSYLDRRDRDSHTYNNLRFTN